VVLRNTYLSLFDEQKRLGIEKDIMKLSFVDVCPASFQTPESFGS